METPKETHAPGAPVAPIRQERHTEIVAPLKKIHLELTEKEALALVALLERWPSRRLAVSTGHSRNTLRAWFLRVAWQIERQGIEPRDRAESSLARKGGKPGA